MKFNTLFWGKQSITILKIIYRIFTNFATWKKEIILSKVEENHEIHKYILDDYVELINNNSFFAGFLEINALSILLNRPILILETMEFENYAFYKILELFNKNSNEYFNINDIIFINFINRDHYQL